MIGVVLLAVVAATGVVGIAVGTRSSGPSLETVWSDWQRPADPRRAAGGHGAGSGPHGGRSSATGVGIATVDRLAADGTRWMTGGRWATHPRVRTLGSALACTGVEPELFAARMIVLAATCAVGPVALWIVLTLVGAPVPLGPVVVVAGTGPVIGVALGVSALMRRAQERRRHMRVVLGSFVDLVVLSLAGGVGVDGALHAASRVTPDWAARRMARALQTARDAGTPPWEALAALGTELGVPELVELSTTVQLAGTEGARIRQSLMARGDSLRRHEQAEAESAANAMTERLFLPGAFLLLGFLVFIGYPAVARILGGF